MFPRRKLVPPAGHEADVTSTPNQTRAFSLIELLITMALIIFMFVMLYSPRSQSHQRKQKLACQKNLQTIYMALQIYANDSNGAFPARAGAQTSEAALSLLVPRYTSVTESFICPGSRDAKLPEGEPFEKRKISYAYYSERRMADTNEVLMTDAQVNALPKTQGQPIFSSDGKKPGNNHNKYGGNFLFCDGNVQMSSAAAPFSLVPTPGVVLLNPRP